MTEPSENFWKKWIEADALEQLEIVQKIVDAPVFDFITDKKLHIGHKKRMLRNLLNSYFNDLYQTMYAMATEEKKEK